MSKTPKKKRTPKVTPPALFAEYAGPKVKCSCDRCEEVKSANGEVLYGWRCLDCHKQYERATCRECGCVAELVAKITRKTYVCRPCTKQINAARTMFGGRAA